jgi:phosphoribosylcarboxyaminoimidazole (NCAIR) mutase
MVVLEPEAAALAAAKCLAVSDPKLRQAIVAYQREVRDRVVQDDQAIRRPESE